MSTPHPLEPTAEEKLALVSQVLDLLPDFFYVHDEDMIFRVCNQKAATYFGFRGTDELVGKSLFDVDSDPEQARFFAEVCRQVMREGQPRITDNLPYRRKDGTGGVLRQHDIPFINPKTGKRMLIGLSRDVTSERELEKQRLRTAELEREMAIARSIQRALLPSGSPCDASSSVMLAAHCEPAAYAGGDFYDWFVRSDGAVVVVIGDVTGHGVGPALLAAECRAYARVLLETMELTPALTRLHELVAGDFSEGRFVTFAAAVIEQGSPRAEVLSAGHGPLLHRRRDGSVSDLEVAGPPLGVIALDDDTKPQRIALEPGDALVLVSDGVYECQNQRGSQMGLATLRRVLAEAGEGLIIPRLLETMRMFCDGIAPQDDVTMVVTQRRL